MFINLLLQIDLCHEKLFDLTEYASMPFKYKNAICLFKIVYYINIVNERVNDVYKSIQYLMYKSYKTVKALAEFYFTAVIVLYIEQILFVEIIGF